MSGHPVVYCFVVGLLYAHNSQNFQFDKSIFCTREEQVGDALRKLHQMEWMRNRKDPHHLASYKQHSRGDVMQDIKKNNKDDEESYYEGTSKVKRERQRKAKQSSSTSSLLSSGFTQSANTGPPPMNAWSQKKGSALFVKPEEEFAVDDEDFMLKQALEESIRTAENEKKNRELMNMYNYGEASSSHAIDKTPVPWRTESEEKNQCRFDKEIKKPDPRFTNTVNTSDYGPSKRSNPVGKTDTHLKNAADYSVGAVSNKKIDPVNPPVSKLDDTSDSGEDMPYPNNRTQTNVTRPKKSYSPQIRITQSVYKQQNQMKAKREVYNSDLSTDYSDEEEDFKSSEVGYSSINASGNFKANMLHDQKHKSPKQDLTNPVVKPVQEKKENASMDDLSKGVRSALTFGDTRGLLDDVEEGNHFSFPEEKSNYSFGSSMFDPNPPNQEKTKPGISPSFPSSVETDELLHSFIRKEPPSTLSNPEQVSEFDRNPIYGTGGTKQFFVHEPTACPHHLHNDENIHPGLAKTNDLDSSSPLSSNSPSQNTPFGSYENQLLAGMTNNMHPQHSPFHYPGFLPNGGSSLQSPLANQSYMSQLPYSNVPPGYGVSNLTNPLLTQIGATNPNMIAGLNDVNPLLAQMSVSGQNLIPSVNDSRNLSMIQAMNQNLSLLPNSAIDSKITTPLGKAIPNQNMTPALNDTAQNLSTNQAVVNQLPLGNMVNKSDLMALIGANNPALDPATLAALTSQAALLNMTPKVDQTSHLYQAQMMAYYNYVAQMQHQARLAAFAGNAECNDDSGQTQSQPPFQFDQAQAMAKEVPKQQFAPENSSFVAMDNHAKGMIPPPLQTQIQPNQANLNPIQDQVSRANSYFSDYQTQANFQSQLQQTVQNDEYTNIKLQMELLAKQYSALQQSLQNKGDNQPTPTPMPVLGQTNVAAPMMMPTQYPIYPTGQFVPAPVMGMPGYNFPMMPSANAPQTSPNTQPVSSIYNMSSDTESPLSNARMQQ